MRKEDIIDKYLIFNQFTRSKVAFKVIYSEYLEKYAVITEAGILFEDGCTYSDKELAKLVDKKPQNLNELKVMHTIKTIFSGSMIID
jgi:hypothetical protein